MSNTNDISHNDILERIRKVLALTTSPNPHEAARAAEKAKELLEAHGLSMHDLHIYTEEQVGQQVYGNITETWLIYSSNKYAPLKSWREQLVWGLGQVLDVKALRAKETGSFHLIGESYSVRALESLYAWIVAQFEVEAAKGWRGYTAGLRDGERRVDPLVYRANFFGEAVMVVVQRLKEHKASTNQVSSNTMALARVVGQQTTQYMKDHHIGTSITATRNGSQYMGKARADGRVAGERAQVSTNRTLGGSQKMLR
mgnify:CR=1 FL=1